MIDFVGITPFMRIALWVAMETPKNTISPWIFENLFPKTGHFPDTKMLITFLKEKVVDQGSFLAKCPRLQAFRG